MLSAVLCNYLAYFNFELDCLFPTKTEAAISGDRGSQEDMSRCSHFITQSFLFYPSHPHASLSYLFKLTYFLSCQLEVDQNIFSMGKAL